jgi:hypothetical protein
MSNVAVTITRQIRRKEEDVNNDEDRIVRDTYFSHLAVDGSKEGDLTV